MPAIYGLCIAIYPISPVSQGGKLGFYLLSCLPEFLCTAVYLGVDLEATFEINEGPWKRRAQRKMRKDTWTGAFVSRRSTNRNDDEYFRAHPSTFDVSSTGGMEPNNPYGDVPTSSSRAEGSPIVLSNPSYF